MRTALLSLLTIFALYSPTQGQVSLMQEQTQIMRCGADEHQAALDALYPELRAQRLAAESNMPALIENNVQNRSSMVAYIPVVFHILYTNAAENIPDARIYEQLDVLNQDYSRTNIDATNLRSQFLNVASNTQIQFCQAQRTTANAPTTGIVRVSYSGPFPSNPHSISPEWDHTQYLNIYIGNCNGVLGYSNYPPGSPGNDHVVILYSTVGGPNVPGTYVPYHLGRTVTHEVGHWLNLQHTFDDGCTGLTSVDCSSSGDNVCDTPPVATPTWGCPTTNPNTCIETSPFPPPYSMDMVNMFENYMDYTDDPCMNTFTNGQASKMNDAISLYRSALLTSQGCVPVGLNEILDASYVMLSPNPSNGVFNIEFNFPSATKVNLEVSDLAGRIVHTSEHDIAFTSHMELDLRDKSEGVYQLTAQTDKGYLVKRIVIAR